MHDCQLVVVDAISLLYRWGEAGYPMLSWADFAFLLADGCDASGQKLDACQSFVIGDPAVPTTPSFSSRCLTVTEAVEDVEDYISMAMMQDLSTGNHSPVPFPTGSLRN